MSTSSARRRPWASATPCSRPVDVGNKLGYIQAMLEFALERPDLGPELMAYLLDLTGSRPARRAAASGSDWVF